MARRRTGEKPSRHLSRVHVDVLRAHDHPSPAIAVADKPAAADERPSRPIHR
jgi:hypothetical protein